jgi:UDP-N-acetylglucosamine--N-acetylmuramyl-(pentapeptide) pyrophosphoryl-undecaprenol N-acetylglucosamine transferase
VLVPLPGAIDDHQTANARSLADAGGAWMMPQGGFTPDALARQIENLFANPELLRAAAANAATCGHADAAARLADLVETHVQESVP